MNHRMIRIFISSTFRNFAAERDILMYQIYPELRELCENSGFSLHFIDLRWGVSKESVAENLAAQVCFDEIARCQELSPELNFLIFAGDRYGWQPLPVRISAKDWDALTGDIPDGAAVRELLHSYYRQDQNDRNRDYVLLSRGNIRASSAAQVSDEEVRRFLWSQARKNLGEKEAELFVASATEQEIFRGFFHAEERTRKNTLILLKQDQRSAARELPEQRLRAERLKNHLRKTSYGTQQLYEYPDGSLEWVKEARKFLAGIITEQISRYESMSEYQCGRQVLENAFQVIADHYVELPEHREAVSFIRAHRGHCVLMKGPSGTGKSWFLRHYAMEQERAGDCVAAVFNDIRPEGHNLLSALEQILEELCQQGLLEREQISRPDPFSPAAWFEAQLGKLSGERKVMIILDTVNEKTMHGYKEINGKSFFRMRLPSCVTMLISAVSEEDLRQEDRKAPVACFTFHTLHCGEAVNLLSALLCKRGRLLQAEQTERAQRLFRENEQELSDPLTAELLAKYFQNLNSWQQVLLKERMTFADVVREVLFGGNRDDYTVLRRHILGFFALSSAGLSELEIQDLLCRDDAVAGEIRRQTEWRFEGAIPNVLWALQYAELKPFLTEFSDHGCYLMKLRHTRLQDEILKALSEAEQKELLLLMREYYGSQKWILSGGKAAAANRRKVREFFPVCEKLHALSALSGCLTDPLCIDAFVRCGMRREIKDYLAAFGSGASAGCMLEKLLYKEHLFRECPDSFLPAVFSDLLAAEKDRTMQEQLKRNLQESGHVHYMETGCVSQDGCYFPQLYGRCSFALNDRGFAAVHMEDRIRMIDLRHMELLKTSCSAKNEQGILYWKEDVLFYRGPKKRIRYKFCEQQLVETGREVCPDWSGLFEEKKMEKAGGWEEAERFEQCRDSDNWLRYSDGQRIRRCELFYQVETTIRARVHGTLAAIVLDERRLEIVNLAAQSVISRCVYDHISHVEWSEHGKELLVVLRGNTLLLLQVDAKRSIAPMPSPDLPYLPYQVRNRILPGMNRFGALLHSFFEYDRRIYTGDAKHLPEQPLFGALSVKYGWAAFYFRTPTESRVRVYRLSDFKRLHTILTSPILSEDAKLVPFYPAEDCSGLILISKGRPVFYDLELQKSMRISNPPSPGQKSGGIFCDQSVIWRVDQKQGLIRVSDAQGKVLAADMTGGKILASDFDYEAHKLFLLLETRQIVTMKLREG